MLILLIGVHSWKFLLLGNLTQWFILNIDPDVCFKAHHVLCILTFICVTMQQRYQADAGFGASQFCELTALDG